MWLLMGGTCWECGAEEELQFDHIQPIGWVPSMYSWSQRMAEYKRALKAGNLQLLCDSCHGQKSRRQQIEEVDPENQPF